MKRFVALCLSAALALACCGLCAGCIPRKQILKVYNWENYLDEDLIPEFETWYEELTGDPIKVEYTTFDVNETMYPRISEAHVDYDVICPSDYMAYKMKSEGLLQPIDKEAVLLAMNEDDNHAGFEDFNAFTFTEPDYETADMYTVGYMWGTVGLLYNNQKVSEEEVKSWDILFDNAATANDMHGKVYMKDSVRESVSTAALYRNRENLRQKLGQPDHSAAVKEIINFRNGDTNDLLADYRALLVKQQKDGLLKGYENDLGKQEFVSGTESVYLGVAWSGDAVWCMFDQKDDEIVGVNSFLSFYVPDDGSNIWFDNWAVPKFANNAYAANLFIGYMSRTSCALRNAEFIGYTPAVISAFDEYRDSLDEDEDLLFDQDGDGEIDETEQHYKDMLLDTLFPSEETQARCAAYVDLGPELTEALDILWRGIK